MVVYIDELADRRVITGVFHAGLDIGGELFACSHHDCGGAHGDSVQDDLRLRISFQDLVDPQNDIQPVVIAVSDIGAFTLSVTAQVGQKDIHAVVIAVVLRVLAHTLRCV